MMTAIMAQLTLTYFLARLVKSMLLFVGYTSTHVEAERGEA